MRETPEAMGNLSMKLRISRSEETLLSALFRESEDFFLRQDELLQLVLQIRTRSDIDPIEILFLLGKGLTQFDLGRRRDQNGDVPQPVRSGSVGVGQRGRGQQLRAWPLHHRQRADRADDGEAAPHGRPLQGSAGFPRVPLVRRRHRIRIHGAPPGTADHRLRQKGAPLFLHLPGASGLSANFSYS